ncbi:hypothetical protein [Ferrimicrobium sp.]|uniref:hypothetical protein n=1 Tax=Ferrimicrobium sp. TaxID=2926050 RepID=UPI002616AC11|nr:hypothetical protein [Ferrimicrobium sp.]
MRPGKAGSGIATAHVRVFDALAQLPIDPTVNEVIVRANSADCSRQFLDAVRACQVRFVVSHAWPQPSTRSRSTYPRRFGS